MNTTSSNKGSKITIIILALVLLGTLFYSYQLHTNNKATQLILENEKIEVLKDLDNMSSLYAEANADNEVANTKLIDAQARLEALVAELKTSKSSIAALLKYKKKYVELESEMEVLLNENATLKFQNALLETALDSTQVQLNSQLTSNNLLSQQNLQLSKTVNEAKKLPVERLKAYGVIQRKSGKLVPTTRASRVDNLRICYTVPSNLLTEAGEKKYFVQVINPNLSVMGSNSPVQFDEDVLKYSYVSAFSYQNELLDVCDFVTADEDSYEKGVYTSLKELLRAMHPTPAVCGTPRQMALDYVFLNEAYDREFYAGFFGELNVPTEQTFRNSKKNIENRAYQPNRKSTHLAVNLRCMKLDGSLATLYSGGGITKNSDPLTECVEIQNKIQTIKKVL